MKRIDANLIGIIGLSAWGAIGVSNTVPLLAAGPRVLTFVPTVLARAICALFAPQSIPVTPFWCYLAASAVAAVVFAGAFWRCVGKDGRRAGAAGVVLFALQIAIALLTDTQLLVIVAIGLAYTLAPRRAVAWLALEMAAYGVLQGMRLTGMLGPAPLDQVAAVLELLMGLAWIALAFGIGYLAARERRGRIRMASLHADLLSTQHLMMDALRLSERANIGRNLHDAIGHHLTALNLHLELGLRQDGERAQGTLRVARDLGKDLLREVRAVVDAEREARFLDLRAALQVLSDAIPAPRVTLHYDETIVIADPESAHAILRCVQEGITNAVRHAGASRIDVVVCAREDGLSVRVVDDGAGSRAFKEGNGLRGMRERIQALRGTLDIDDRPGSGFGLHAVLPGRAP